MSQLLKGYTGISSTTSCKPALKAHRHGLTTRVPDYGRRCSVNAHAVYSRDEPAISVDCQILRAMTADLAEHCVIISNEKQGDCAELATWFGKKCQEVEAAMTLDPGSDKAIKAETLRHTLRELAACGSMAVIYNALQVMKHMEEKQAAGYKPPQPITIQPSLPAPQDPEFRSLLVGLFNRADTDQNGKLSWSEFNDALHFINDDLCEDDLELVGGTLDLQGSVTLEQFLAIVELGEAARAAPTSDAQFLRHLTHHQPSYIDHVTAHHQK